jgi:hypothetical protein
MPHKTTIHLERLGGPFSHATMALCLAGDDEGRFKTSVLPYLRERGHLIDGLDDPEVTVKLDVPEALLLDVMDAVGPVLRCKVAVRLAEGSASNGAALRWLRQRAPHAKDVVLLD